MIRTLLIANRGEIAVRIIRAAREMGIRTVAVASEADEHAAHALLADVCVPIGAPEPSASYLDIDKILDAARATGADAIHPGYGFLSERAEFAEACEAAGIAFVGPSGAAMRKLGAKIDAKQLAVEAGVPVTPGFFEPGASVDALRAAALEIGYPVMLKASAGGGGRGMRALHDPADFDRACALASEEALKAFGDGAMMVEKLVERPRHIEVQVLADAHGQVACLFERECSIQRRHQKLIEEAPAPAVHAAPELWDTLRAACDSLIRAAGYVGAGTVEFMLDPATNSVYFLEVNARLQVEHPVTECVAGLDLVQWQIRIAQGERLALPAPLLAGDRSALRGHAIEARVVAEDPAQGFLPSVGKILAWVEPVAPGIRVDTGFGPGAEISRHYDSLIAKVIAHAETRPLALAKLIHALEEFHILGVRTNVAYLLEILRSDGFASGAFDTGYLARTFPDWTDTAPIPDLVGALAETATSGTTPTEQGIATTPGAWDANDTFRI